MHNGIKAYMKVNGDTVAGRKVEILVRDTTGPLPDVS
jgi:branched-chain amino acid transport system substrate-binding protein